MGCGIARTSKPVAGESRRLRRPKVLHVINGLGAGGAEAVLYRLVTSAQGSDHEIVSLGAPDWYSAKLAAEGVTVHHLDWSLPALARVASRLRSIVRGTDADVVQTWMYRSNLLGGLAARAAGRPVVWNIRCSALAPVRFSSRLLARASGYFASWLPDLTINCSRQSVGVHTDLGYDPDKTVVIPNGYALDSFGPDEAARERTRQSLGLRSDTFVIGSVGRFHPQKGFPILLAAVGALLRRGMPVRLVLAGRGVDESNPELKRLIAEAGCGEAVQLLGQRDDIAALDRAFDLHVLASIGAEGFPNVVAESMLSGTPNVATDIGDSALIIGDTGWIVPPANADALATAIETAHREWSSNPGQWADRRMRARERIVENFSLEKMVRAYEDIWMRYAKATARER